MAKFNVVVYGGVPLDFFLRRFRKGNTLRLLHNNKLDESQAYFERDRYCYSDTPDQRDGTLLIEVATPNPYDNIHIILKCTSNPPIMDFQNKFSCTPLANFFTWNKAYSLSQANTFVHNKEVGGICLASYTLYPGEPAPWHSTCFSLLYGGRQCEDFVGCHPSYHTLRRSGDKYNWIIPFVTDSLHIDKEKIQPDFVLEYSTFSMLPCESPGNLIRFLSIMYPCKVDIYEGTTLRCTYTVGTTMWGIEFSQKIKELEELNGMPPSVPPAIITNPPVTFDKSVNRLEEYSRVYEPPGDPATWQYFDYEIPALYEEWKRILGQESF